MSYYSIWNCMLFHFIVLFIIFYYIPLFLVVSVFVYTIHCSTILFYVILCYVVFKYLYLLCQKNSIVSKCDEIVSTWACEFFYLHCFGGCVADVTMSTMEVVSSSPVPIVRLAHRATDLVKDQGLWVDVKFLHANNPGKQVLQHGCKWMSPFFWDIERYSRPDWRLTIWTSPFLRVWLESW